ncbi:MAG: putative hydride transferase [Actinomycetia bacterium]|nr:putative hydride transferase [Actinomycetes bacterium]
MRYGLAIPQVGSLADPSIIRAVAVEADRSGFASLWALDRLLAPVAPRAPYPAAPDGVLPLEQHTVLDPLGVLTLAATVTSNIRVGTNVLVAPWYPAVLLARALSTLDHLSGGRLTVGLGLGWSADEYDAVGVPQRDLAAQAEETLDVLDAVWTSDVVEHHGARFEIRPSTILPKPVQRPRPPLLLAAYTPAGLDRIARRADGWTPAGLPVDAIAPMWMMLRDAAAGHGRDPDTLDLVVRANIKVLDTPLGGERPSYWGTVEQIVDDIDATRQAGAHEIILDLQACTTTADELLDLAGALVRHDRAAVA